jgi:hypothetical protein
MIYIAASATVGEHRKEPREPLVIIGESLVSINSCPYPVKIKRIGKHF